MFLASSVVVGLFVGWCVIRLFMRGPTDPMDEPVIRPGHMPSVKKS